MDASLDSGKREEAADGEERERQRKIAESKAGSHWKAGAKERQAISFASEHSLIGIAQVLPEFFDARRCFALVQHCVAVRTNRD